MLTQSRLTVMGTLMAVAIAVSFSTAACCPPNCPPTPPLMNPPRWDNSFDEGNYEMIIQETSQVIEQGEEAEFYAEAHLYRGLALLRNEGDLESVKADLQFAEANLDKLATVDQKKEHTLLFRGLMVYHAKSGDLALAEEYMNRAIELSPEQKDLILKEYEEAARQ